MAKVNTYTALNAEMKEVFEKYPNTSKKLIADLQFVVDSVLKPKTTRGTQPHILNEDGSIKEAFCRYHNRYEKAEDMLITGKTQSKGLCKAASREYHKRNTAIKTLAAEASELLIKGDFESAVVKAKESEAMKAQLTNPDNYDYDADWTAYNAAARKSKS